MRPHCYFQYITHGVDEMKRFAVLAFCVVTIIGGSVAHAADDAFNIGLGYDFWGYGVSVRAGGLSGLVSTSSIYGLAVSADYKLTGGDISSMKNLDWYAGAGACIATAPSTVYADFGTAIGVRGTAGLKLKFADRLEAFSQVSPTFQLAGSWYTGLLWGYSAGIRYQL